MKKSKAIGHIVSHTHWDREWRYPIWHNRILLEELMENLLVLLEKNSKYKCFVMDAQVVPIEDYLAICPESTERVKTMVSQNRIQIGPWYTLPDQFSVDGECLIRNLMEGNRLCKKFGGTMKIGFTTFGWGQPAQMPQIYANFGIDTVLGGKNVSQERAGYNEFIWKGPDGTEILASKLGVQGRANFFKFATIPTVLGVENIGDDWRFQWDDSGLIFHRADAENYWQDYHRLHRPKKLHLDKLKQAVENAWRTTDETSLKEHRILFDGGDFTYPQSLLPKIIEEANKVFDEKEFRHESLDEYVNVLKDNVDRSKLKVVEGELRDGPEYAVTPNALAVRSDIKRANRKAQNALIKIAEPLSVAAMILGEKYCDKYLGLAWNYLLKAHCHDSINGVAQDKSARDTLYRVEQAAELAEDVTDTALQNIIKHIDLKSDDETGIFLVIFNSLSFARSEPVKIVIDTPQQWNADLLSISDSQENIIESEQSGRMRTCIPVNEMDSRPWPFYVDRHFIDLDTSQIPPLGYKVYKVKPKTFFDTKAIWPETKLVRKTLVPRPNVLENEFLRVEINPNGTFNLFDKQNEKLYTGLHYFEDSGDIGDGWVRYVPAENKTFTNITSKAGCYVTHDTSLCGSITVETTMNLPANCDRNSGCRSEQTSPVIIKSELTLQKNQMRLDIHTTLENIVEDHRLRVMFPTDIVATHSDAEGHFTVDRRPIRPLRNEEGLYRPGMQTLPQQSFVDVSDGKVGLAILNDGLCEYEVLDEERRTIALTLLRAVNPRICTEPRVGAEFSTQNGRQMQGHQEFRYSVYPHNGNWFRGNVHQESLSFNIPLQIVQSNAHKLGHLPKEQSFLRIEPQQVQFSCIKKTQDRNTVIVRLFNPSDNNIDVHITSYAEIKNAAIVNMDEVLLSELETAGGRTIDLKLEPYKVLTIELELV